MATKEVSQPFSKFFLLFTPFIRRYIEARTLFQPLRWLHYPITVGIRTQIAVSADASDGKILLQRPDQSPQGEFLLLGPCIGRKAPFVQTAFVGDADAVLVVSSGMGTRHFQRSGTPDVTILTDVEMITHTGHPPRPMTTEQVLLRKVYIHSGSGAMYHD